MSAINPASFASPSLGLQTPSGIGPGAVGVGRGTTNDRRPNPQQDTSATFPNATAGARSYTGPMAFGNERGSTPFGQAQQYPYSYGGFATPPRPAPNAYNPTTVDPYANAFPGNEYQLRSRAGFSPPSSGNDQLVSPLTTQNDWVGAFQSLSLNSTR